MLLDVENLRIKFSTIRGETEAVKGISFGIGEDEQAERYVREAFPECSVHTIGMEEMAVEGGALHCLTWNIVR